LPDFSGVCPVGHDRISLRDVLMDVEIRVGLGTEKRIEVGLNPGAPFLRACVWNRRRAGTVKFTISRAIVKNRGEISTSKGGKQGLVVIMFCCCSWPPPEGLIVLENQAGEPSSFGIPPRSHEVKQKRRVSAGAEAPRGLKSALR
jgi:hypothetical protein